MSGLAARFFLPLAPDAISKEEGTHALFAGPSHDVRSYMDSDVVLIVAGRFPGATPPRSCGQIVETDRYVLAVEGYLFNARDLRALLNSFAHEGARVLSLLQGAYTLVIWDKANKSATVNTCRFGQRHLYSRATAQGLTIASDLRALRHLSATPFELDADTAWMSFLYGGVSGSGTPIRGVTRILPGSTLTICRGGLSEVPALDLGSVGQGTTGDTRHCLERLDGAMGAALHALGQLAEAQAVMMGSGVDSSLVAAYARREVRDLVAVTQQMPGSLDESRHAKRIADGLSIPHQVVPYQFEQRELLADVASFVRIAEEPAYWNQLGPPLVSLLDSLRQAPQAFLTGAEGDFLFNYRTLPVSVSAVIRNGLFGPVAAHVARRMVNRVTRHTYIVGDDFDLLDRPLMRQHLATYPAAAQVPYYVHAYDHLPAGPNPQRHFLNNGWQNVRIISQFGRAAGWEVLFPYMDDGVVSAVLSLPEEMKINKVLLRLLLRRFLPRAIVPTRKTGYWAHTVRWHYESGALGDVLDLLTEQKTVERGLYDRRALGELVRTYGARLAQPRHHPVLWQILIFEVFCREFLDQG